jgi:membrane associated rhomboid family serine protease
MNEAAVGHQCPDCVAEGRRTQRTARTAFGAVRGAGERGYVTLTLVMVNVLMLAWSALSNPQPLKALVGGSGSGLGGALGGETPLMDKLAVIGQVTTSDHVTHAYGVADGQYYRLFTAMFMHYGLLHLATNMWALWILGRTLESMLGPGRFLALYLICGLGGDVAAYVYQPGDLSAGASTAIFGLFTALFIALRKLRLSTSSVLPLIIINLIFTFSIPGISIAGHVGGLITGAVAGFAIAYAPRSKRTVLQIVGLGLIVVLLCAMTIYQTGQINS